MKGNVSKYGAVFRGLSAFSCLTLWLSIAAPGHATAATYGPLQTRSQNPLYLQWLALPMEAPATLQQGQSTALLHTTFSNVFERITAGNTLLDLDMELWRTALVLGYGCGRHVDMRLELPFISTGGGFLDGFIQDFHATFGFPNGNRELVEDNQFSYRMSQEGIVLFDYGRQPLGLSDVVIRGKFFVPATRALPIDLAVLPYLKLPTGRQSAGLSSGRVDGGLAVLAQTSWGRLALTTQLGGVLLGGHADIGNLLRRGFFSFGQSVEYRMVRWLAVIGQLTGNTSAFQHVHGTSLSDIVLDLNMGVAGAFRLGRAHETEFTYQVAFTEDLLGRGPSVDFSVFFLVGLRFRPVARPQARDVGRSWGQIATPPPRMSIR